MARILGITFAIKLMERGEANAQVVYESTHVRHAGSGPDYRRRK